MVNKKNLTYNEIEYMKYKNQFGSERRVFCYQWEYSKYEITMAPYKNLYLKVRKMTN